MSDITSHLLKNGHISHLITSANVIKLYSQQRVWQTPNARRLSSLGFSRLRRELDAYVGWVYPNDPTDRIYVGTWHLRMRYRDTRGCCNSKFKTQNVTMIKITIVKSKRFWNYLSSWAIAAICSTRSWCAARSDSKASCFFFRALSSFSLHCRKCWDVSISSLPAVQSSWASALCLNFCARCSNRSKRIISDSNQSSNVFSANSNPKDHFRHVHYSI